MAMITCPNCGGQISDKAKKCVHCGAVLTDEKRICIECGAELEEGENVCRKCGCPADADGTNTVPQQVEVTGIKIKKNSVKMVIIALGILVAVIGTSIGVGQAQKHKAAEEAENISKEYTENLNLVAYTMLSGAGDAETSCNLIKKVWYDAIYEEYNSDTYKYTQPNGYMVSDFNEAIRNLFLDSDFNNKINNIKENKETVDKLMKKLKNPPDEHRDAYNALTGFYDAYLSLLNLATSPTGSLETYSTNFGDADADVLTQFNVVKVYLDY